MTAMSVQTYDLSRAANLAGHGGTVSRSNIDYTVVYRNGEYMLRLATDGNEHNAQPLTDFVSDGWTVSGEAAPTLTVQQYFSSLPIGSHVRREGLYDTYVWSGRTAGANRAPVLFSLEYGTELVLELIDRDNTWAAVVGDDGDPVVADTLTNRLMSRCRSLAVQSDEARMRAATMETDWSFLNERLNEYADEQRMCPDYERRLDTWNEGLQLLKLEGRKRDYTVRVAVEATYYIDVTVRASSEDAAHDEVNEAYASDLMEENGDWSMPDEIEHRVL